MDPYFVAFKLRRASDALVEMRNWYSALKRLDTNAWIGSEVEWSKAMSQVEDVLNYAEIHAKMAPTPTTAPDTVASDSSGVRSERFEQLGESAGAGDS